MRRTLTAIVTYAYRYLGYYYGPGQLLLSKNLS